MHLLPRTFLPFLLGISSCVTHPRVLSPPQLTDDELAFVSATMKKEISFQSLEASVYQHYEEQLEETSTTLSPSLETKLSIYLEQLHAFQQLQIRRQQTPEEEPYIALKRGEHYINVFLGKILAQGIFIIPESPPITITHIDTSRGIYPLVHYLFSKTYPFYTRIEKNPERCVDIAFPYQRVEQDYRRRYQQGKLLAEHLATGKLTKENFHCNLHERNMTTARVVDQLANLALYQGFSSYSKKELPLKIQKALLHVHAYEAACHIYLPDNLSAEKKIAMGALFNFTQATTPDYYAMTLTTTLLGYSSFSTKNYPFDVRDPATVGSYIALQRIINSDDSTDNTLTEVYDLLQPNEHLRYLASTSAQLFIQ